jgi:hypothetical protein
MVFYLMLQTIDNAVICRDMEEEAKDVVQVSRGGYGGSSGTRYDLSCSGCGQ